MAAGASACGAEYTRRRRRAVVLLRRCSLVDLGQLVWLNAIYDVDLRTYEHDPGYTADLKSIAQGIMDAHDPAYDASYR